MKGLLQEKSKCTPFGVGAGSSGSDAFVLMDTRDWPAVSQRVQQCSSSAHAPLVVTYRAYILKH